MSFFIFGVYFQPYVRRVGPTQFEMPLWHNQYHNEGHQFVFKVVRLGQQPFFLGAICFRRPPVRFDAPSGWSIGSPGALSSGPVKEVMHAFYPATGWPSPLGGSLDFEAWQAARAEKSTDAQFASDYGGVIERLEAELGLHAVRDVPRLALLGDGAGLLAEIIDGPVLVPADLQTRAGATRIAALIVAMNAMRAVRGCALLLRSGYTREALAVLERLKSAHRLVVIFRSDQDGALAQRFIDGSDLSEISTSGLGPDPEATSVMGEHLPRMSLVESPSGPQRGLSFVGPGNKEETDRFALMVAALLVDVVDFAARVLRSTGAPPSLVLKHKAFNTAVKAEIDLWSSEHAETDAPQDEPAREAEVGHDPEA